MVKKLKDRKGETLTESLCSLLVVLLSVTLFATLISAAARISTAAEKQSNDLYAGLFEAEAPTADGGDSHELTVTVDNGGDGILIYVDIVGDNGLYAYRKGR